MPRIERSSRQLRVNAEQVQRSGLNRVVKGTDRQRRPQATPGRNNPVSRHEDDADTNSATLPIQGAPRGDHAGSERQHSEAASPAMDSSFCRLRAEVKRERVYGTFKRLRVTRLRRESGSDLRDHD
jgi:hypothetical protein